MDRIIAFDLWGRFAHYKKIYATTTALTYPIPVKTAIYGTIGAIIGLSKAENRYLQFFKPGDCKIGIQIQQPLNFQRININLRAVFGPMKATDNRKPTLMEFVYQPRYRIYVAHKNDSILTDLEQCLRKKESVYTPSLGLAGLLANFEFVGAWQYQIQEAKEAIAVHSVIPRRNLVAIDPNQSFKGGNRIVEISQYALEMDEQRNVLDRDDIILDQGGQTIFAKVSSFTPLIYPENNLKNVILF